MIRPLGGALERSGDLLWIVRFKNMTLEIQRIAMLAHLDGPFLLGSAIQNLLPKRKLRALPRVAPCGGTGQNTRTALPKQPQHSPAGVGTEARPWQAS